MPSNSFSPAAEVAASAERHKDAVLSTVMDHIEPHSPHEPLAIFAEGLASNGCLRIDCLTGGLTNAAYRIYLDKFSSSPSPSPSPSTPSSPPRPFASIWPPPPAVFAKLGFSFAFWSPSRLPYDTSRLLHESEAMSLFSQVAPGKGANAFFLHEIEGVGQLLVTSYASGIDEQLASQFIEGSVDPRPILSLASSLARFNCIPSFDPDFNDNVRPAVRAMMSAVSDAATLSSLLSRDPPDRASSLALSFGGDLLSSLFTKVAEDYERRTCLLHSDVHVFNVLVEPRPGDVLGEFGEEGVFALIDFESEL